MPRVARRSWLQAHIARTCEQRSSSFDVRYVAGTRCTYTHQGASSRPHATLARMAERAQESPRDTAAGELVAEIMNVRWTVPDGDFAVLDAVSDDGEPVVLVGALGHVREGESVAAGGGRGGGGRPLRRGSR